MELGVAGCKDGDAVFKRKRKRETRLAHNALMAVNDEASFVLEHGDCVISQMDNGNKERENRDFFVYRILSLQRW